MATTHYNAQATSGITGISTFANDKTPCAAGGRKGRPVFLSITANPEQVTCKRCIKALTSRTTAKAAEPVKVEAPTVCTCGYLTDSIGHKNSH